MFFEHKKEEGNSQPKDEIDEEKPDEEKPKEKKPEEEEIEEDTPPKPKSADDLVKKRDHVIVIDMTSEDTDQT